MRAKKASFKLATDDGIVGVTVLSNMEELKDAPDGYYVVNDLASDPSAALFFSLLSSPSIQEGDPNGFYLCYGDKLPDGAPNGTYVCVNPSVKRS